MPTTSEAEAGPGAQPVAIGPTDISEGRRTWAILVLAAIALLAAVDRNVLSVLLVPIKHSLHASDAAMGALTGAAYALVYSTLAIPMARFADRTNRRNLIAFAVALWSGMTALSGLASTFVQLLIARVGVAVGESTQMPASFSMIGDMFPPTRRGGAIGVMTVGSVLGFSIGAFIAGVLNDRFGWHIAMMAVGLPGLLVALIVWLTIREPVRGGQDGGLHDLDASTLLGALRRLTQIRCLPWLLTGLIFLNICFSGNLVWLPAFLMRVHHLTTTTMSAVFGLTVIVATVSNALAGFASDWIAKRGPRWRMYYAFGMALIASPFYAAAFLVSGTVLSTALVMVFSLVAGGLTTVTSASMISIAPANMRASMAALSGVTVSVFGGLGAFVIGLLNDVLYKQFGDYALRYTMLMLPASLLISALIFLIASRGIDQDVADVAGRARL
jgi:predicted MFS family arabinose efflux permease